MKLTPDEYIQQHLGEGLRTIARGLAERFPEAGRTVEQWRSLVRHRAERHRANPHTALEKECEAVGIPVTDVGNYWYKGEHFSIHARQRKLDIRDILREILDEVKEYAPAYPTIPYPDYPDAHLLVIDPADVHIGKLCKAIETGDEYNADMAVSRIRAGVEGILLKAQGFNVERILLIIGNDILHVDTPKNTTTAGTFQDSHIMWYEAFGMAKKVYIEVIERLMQVAPVHVQYDPSNHDYTNGFLLADTLASWFHRAEAVTFNVSPAHRKYYTYGKNLIGTTHGDGAREADLPLLMAHEAAEHWAACKHRYFYCHHLHRKSSKDYMSVCVEVLRSPSGTDSWHMKSGYAHSPKAVEGFIHHPEYGQIARLTNIF
jgi:hypothetical protein